MGEVYAESDRACGAEEDERRRVHGLGHAGTESRQGGELEASGPEECAPQSAECVEGFL